MNLKPIRNYVAATVLGGAAALGMTSCVNNDKLAGDCVLAHDIQEVRNGVDTMKRCFNALDALEKDTVDFSHSIDEYLHPEEIEFCENVFHENGVHPLGSGYQKFKEEFCKIADRFLKADSAFRAAITPADSIATKEKEFHSAARSAREALGLPYDYILY